MDRSNRYARQRVLSEIGEEGQRKLALSSVLIAGCGALGGLQAELLARAGIGKIRLADCDVVAWSNLPRQILYGEKDAGTHALKTEAAARRIIAVNSETAVDQHAVHITAENVEGLLDGIDLVLDGTDNFEARYVLNDACMKHGKTWIYGGVIGTTGMMMVIRPGIGPCLRCLMRTPPPPGAVPSTETYGVLNTAAAAVASLQATAALRMLTGTPPSRYSLYHLNPWDMTFDVFDIVRDADCPCCCGRYDFLPARQR